MTEMKARLDSVAPELADRLRSAGEDGLRQVAATVSYLAMESLVVTDPRLDRALTILRLGRAGGKEQVELRGLVEELDDAAWAIQELVDSGRSSQEEYVKAFRTARAVSTVAFALDTDPRLAAMEAVYEAQAAVGDVNPVRVAVLDLLRP